MALGGYANQIAWVDLTEGEVELKACSRRLGAQIYWWARSGCQVCV